MLTTTKIRTTTIALVISAGFAAASVTPAVSQAQWHTLVIDGHVITHNNFTEGGVSPCTRIDEQLGKAQGAVGDYTEWEQRHDAGESTASKERENAEGEANRLSGEAFEYGCGVAASPATAKSPQTVKAAIGSIHVKL
jgi:hypothetical protein